MKKLFLKVYIPLAVCVIMTLLLSVVAITRIIPAQLDSYRRNIEEFQNFVLSSGHLTREAIEAAADSLELSVMVTQNVGHIQRMPPPEGFFRLPGLPPDFPWRIDITGGPRHGPGSYLRLSFWILLLALLLMEGLVLLLALWPMRKRLSKLDWIASEFGSGNLGVRLQARRKGDLIDAVGNTFNDMASQIQTLVSSHQELLGIVAHELRTPMTRMRLALELLREDAGDSDLSKIERMEKDLVSLDTLVTELLAFNRLRRHDKIEKVSVDLLEICNELVQAETWRRDDVTVNVTGSGNTPGDRKLLGRAIGNLIRNATRHASSRVTVTITGRTSDGFAEVCVEDDGSGFDPAIQSRLGEPFVKGHSSDGTGLGLAITGRIAGLHGGSVFYGSSESLGGAQVRFTVPLS